MWFFSVLQLLVRPYTDDTNNILSIAFSVCDILGVYAAYPKASTAEIQIAFVVLTLVMVIITAALLLRSTCRDDDRRRRILSEQKRSETFSAMFAMYSHRERWFLAPILVIVWVSRKSTRCACRRIHAARSRKNDRPSADATAAASSVAATVPSERTLPRQEHHQQQQSAAVGALVLGKGDEADDGDNKWTEVHDPSSSKTYFYNKETQETSWSKPSSVGRDGALDTAAAAAAVVAAAGQWTEATDPATGQTYFYNPTPEETSWARPNPTEGHLRAERMRWAVMNQLSGMTGRARVQSRLLRERGLPSLARDLARRAVQQHRQRIHSRESMMVMEMADMAAAQRRDATEMHREAASERLKQRILQRRGVVLAPAGEAAGNNRLKETRRKKLTTSVAPQRSAAEVLAHEQALTTSHRVQVEARLASKVHAEKTQEKRKISRQKLSGRLAARNKVKSSRCLQKCPAFSTLDHGSVAQIVDAMEYFGGVRAGDMLCREGDAADKMFVIVSGTCDVSIRGARVASLKDLDVFGEAALFPDASGASVRSATVRAAAGTAVKLLVLHKSDLDALVKSRVLQPECVRALSAVAAQRRLENKERDEK